MNVASPAHGRFSHSTVSLILQNLPAGLSVHHPVGSPIRAGAYYQQQAVVDTALSSRYDDRSRGTKRTRRDYPCSICGRVFSCATNVKAHIRVHLGLKPFRCRVCGREGVRKEHILGHLINVHKILENTSAYIENTRVVYPSDITTRKKR